MSDELGREELERLYREKRLSTTKIAKMHNLSEGKVWRLLKKYDIPIRNRSQATTGRHNPFFEKKHNDVTKIKMSESHKGELNPRWKGGRRISDGYMYILKPNHPNADSKGYVAEHRLIAEKALGRYLTTDEIPHHINEDSLDNRNCNFLICTNSYHAWLHAKMRRLGVSINV